MPCEKYFVLRKLRRNLKQFNEITFIELENIKSHTEAVDYDTERERMKNKLGFNEKIKEVKKSTGDCMENIPNLIQCWDCEREAL